MFFNVILAPLTGHASGLASVKRGKTTPVPAFFRERLIDWRIDNRPLC
jgi:hypothetical protein